MGNADMNYIFEML